jgi:hypothetical protein
MMRECKARNGLGMNLKLGMGMPGKEFNAGNVPGDESTLCILV